MRRNVKSDFRIHSHNVIIRTKNDCVNRIQENVALRKALTKMTTALFRGK